MKPPLLVYSTLGKRVYIVTRYRERPDWPGLIVAERKYDVTDQFKKVRQQYADDEKTGQDIVKEAFDALTPERMEEILQEVEERFNPRRKDKNLDRRKRKATRADRTA